LFTRPGAKTVRQLTHLGQVKKRASARARKVRGLAHPIAKALKIGRAVYRVLEAN
jgi:hypothetical protein